MFVAFISFVMSRINISVQRDISEVSGTCGSEKEDDGYLGCRAV
jgi:hypothetical protein